MAGQTYCIGTPGQPPRMFLTCDETFAASQLSGGEVYFCQPNYIAPPHNINVAGDGLEAAAVPLDDQKAARWIDARSYRDLRQNSTCPVPVPGGGTVVAQCDADSRLKINGAVTMAIIAKTAGRAFSIDWTMFDNSVVNFDGDGMIAFGAVVGEYFDACQSAGTAIRDQIDAATDAAALAAIDVQAGYPST